MTETNNLVWNPFTNNFDYVGIIIGGEVSTLTGDDDVPVLPVDGNIDLNSLIVPHNTNPTPLYIKNTSTGVETFELQLTNSFNSSNVNNAGICSFDNRFFSVDSNGWVSFLGFEMTWIDEAVSFNASAGHGYFVSSTATATLPPTPTQGQTIEIFVDTNDTVTIQANTNQYIQIGGTISASAGIATSNIPGSTLKIVYRVADTTWHTTGVNGVWEIT
jgi:hypothetical protein